MCDFGLFRSMARSPRHPDEAKKKYPKHLVPNKVNQMDAKGFFMWSIEQSPQKLGSLLAIVILIVLALMLFPIWPLQVKIVIWYISFYLLMFLVSVCLLTCRPWPPWCAQCCT